MKDRAYFDRRADELIEIICANRGISIHDIVGCSEEEIRGLEEKYDVTLPLAYRVFLERLGKSWLDFDGFGLFSDLEGIHIDATQFFKNLQDGYYDYPESAGIQLDKSVPPKVFPFFQYCVDDEFAYFVADGTNDDPPIMAFMDGHIEGAHNTDDLRLWDFMDNVSRNVSFVRRYPPELTGLPTRDLSVTKTELETLPLFAIVAWAAMTAQRIAPLYKVSWPAAPDDSVKQVSDAVDITAACARLGGTRRPYPDHPTIDLAHSDAMNAAASALHASNASFNAARRDGLTKKETTKRYTAAIVAEAANLAAFAAAYACQHKSQSLDESETHAQGYFDATVRCAHKSASFAATAAAEQVERIRQDFEKLQSLSKSEGWNHSTPVDPKILNH